MRSEAWARRLGTGLGVVGGFILGYAMVRKAVIPAPGSGVIISLTTLEGLIFSYLGTPYLLGGWKRLNFQLRTTPLPDLVAGLFGLIVGLLIAVRYSPRRLWPHRQFNIFAVHQWTAHLLLASIALHIVLLFFLPRPHWRAVDVFLPLHSPVQPVENTIGAASVYLVVVVVLTSYFRLQLGRRRWKLFHFLVYAAAIGIFSHGLLANPQLTNAPIDPLDAEKLLVEFCFLVVTLMTAWALRYRVRKARMQKGPTQHAESLLTAESFSRSLRHGSANQ